MEEKGTQVKKAIQKIIMKQAALPVITWEINLPPTPPPTPLNTLIHAHSQGEMKHTRN